MNIIKQIGINGLICGECGEQLIKGENFYKCSVCGEIHIPFSPCTIRGINILHQFPQFRTQVPIMSITYYD
jgi:hypothetical protein